MSITNRRSLTAFAQLSRSILSRSLIRGSPWRINIKLGHRKYHEVAKSPENTHGFTDLTPYNYSDISKTFDSRHTYVSHARRIQSQLSDLRHDRWGWVFYRCDYSNERAWRIFKMLATRRMETCVKYSDAPELLQKLDMRFVDDKFRLDGASRADLRLLHKAWATDVIMRENPGHDAAKFSWFTHTRYRHFIQVDKEVLDILTEISEPTSRIPHRYIGVLNFVDAEWEADVGREEGDEELEPSHDPQGHEPIDGVTEHDVGWMRLSVSDINTEHYEGMSRSLFECIYERPPSLPDW